MSKLLQRYAHRNNTKNLTQNKVPLNDAQYLILLYQTILDTNTPNDLRQELSKNKQLLIVAKTVYELYTNGTPIEQINADLQDHIFNDCA